MIKANRKETELRPGKDISAPFEKMKQRKNLNVTLEVGKIGGCESEIYRLVRRNRWF